MSNSAGRIHVPKCLSEHPRHAAAPPAGGRSIARVRMAGICRYLCARHHRLRPKGYAPPSEIDDVVQDVLLGFFAAIPEFTYDPARGRFRGYLKTCTWRKLQARMGNRLLVKGHAIEDIDSAEPAVEAVWDDLWQSQRLQKALALTREHYLARPDRARTFLAFEMYAILERPAEEVARELEMSVAGVHQAKTRISKALRETMEALEDFAD